jgi:hypothetical protein
VRALVIWGLHEHLDDVDVQFDDVFDHFRGEGALLKDQLLQVLVNLNSVTFDLGVHRSGSGVLLLVIFLMQAMQHADVAVK